MHRSLLMSFFLLFGCAHLPAQLRPVDMTERGYVRAALDAWEAQREPAECPALERVHVYSAPQPVVADWCHRPGSNIHGCVNTARGLFESPRTNIYLRDDVDEYVYTALFMHEVLHVQRGCWVLETFHSERYLERYFAGRTDEDCNPLNMVDAGHCDSQLWLWIEQDAIRRASP